MANYDYSDDDNTLQRWIKDRIKHSEDNDDDDFDDSFDVSADEVFLFLWVLTLLLCGCICCCCALCCSQPMWFIGFEALTLGILILNWNFGHFPFMLLIFTALSLYLLMQTIQRMRENELQHRMVKLDKHFFSNLSSLYSNMFV